VADYARVMAANDEALKWAGLQVDVQQASLDALTAQVSGLITINDSVLTVAQAIANLQAAMGTATGFGVKDGSHAGGLASVPFDGYAAELHRGEVVVDAPAAAAMRRYFGGAKPGRRQHRCPGSRDQAAERENRQAARTPTKTPTRKSPATSTRTTRPPIAWSPALTNPPRHLPG
jgi:hypothetical protein